jgi:formiminoglutamate deiminase
VTGIAPSRSSRSATGFWCERVWLGDRVERDVVVCSGADGMITEVSKVGSPPAGARRLPGLVLPGMANAHSHAFHRALRGRVHGVATSSGELALGVEARGEPSLGVPARSGEPALGRPADTFWAWREAMYALAARLDPEGYRRLATAVYAEMVLAGWTCVGEFHYLHHAPGGARYDDPNAMGAALCQAARDAGIRLTLLDACYLAGGIGEPVTGTQLRFSDRTVDVWAARAGELADSPLVRIGAAIHSVRAVPAGALPDVVAASGDRPLHVHLSEQPAENQSCLAAYGRTPARLLHDAGALGPRTTAVHATHLTGEDVELLGSAGVTVCACPTTEADLADGIGPMRALADAGCPLALGSDQHAVVDPFAEARGLEAGQRLASLRRGRFAPARLVRALTVDGYAALGWPGGGRIAAGAPCDLVAVRLDSPRTAGCEPEQVVLAASASDVDTVIVGGEVVVSGGTHRMGDIGAALAGAIGQVWA